MPTWPPPGSWHRGRDGDGFRLPPDGRRFAYKGNVTGVGQPDWGDALEIIREPWREPGVDLNIMSVTRPICHSRGKADENGFMLQRARLVLDKPLQVQYLKWVTNLLQGDFGMSFEWRQPMSERVRERLGLTRSARFPRSRRGEPVIGPRDREASSYGRGLLHPFIDCDVPKEYQNRIDDVMDAEGHVHARTEPGLGQDLNMDYIEGNLLNVGS